MNGMYIIVISEYDEEYFGNINYYFKDITVDEYGKIKILKTEDPFEAKRFPLIRDRNSKNCILNVVKDSIKGSKVSVKCFNYTIDNE